MENNIKKEIKTNEDMLEKLQKFCKENNLQIVGFNQLDGTGKPYYWEIKLVK